MVICVFIPQNNYWYLFSFIHNRREYLSIYYFKMNSSAQLDAYFSVQSSEYNFDDAPAHGSPQSPYRVNSPVLDVDNFLYHDEPLYPTHFERILDSPQLYLNNRESPDYGTLSVSLPLATHSPQAGSNYPQQNLGNPRHGSVPFISKTDTHSPRHVRPIAPYNFTKMTPNPSITPSSTNRMIRRSHSAELRQLDMFHSPIQYNQTFYPVSDCTPHNRMCSHHATTHSTPVCCNSKYPSPIDSCECPYPPAMNKGCVPQQCVTVIPNYVKPSIDQFNTPTISKKECYPPNISVSSSSGSLCYSNCGCSTSYIEEGICDSITPISSQSQCSSCVSTQEGNSYDIFPPESASSQELVIADTSQHSESFENYFHKMSSTKREKYSRKKKEEKKRNSERERARIRNINKAFKDLGDLCCLHLKERAQTKVATIHQALDLIQRLHSRIASQKASISECLL